MGGYRRSAVAHIVAVTRVLFESQAVAWRLVAHFLCVSRWVACRLARLEPRFSRGPISFVSRAGV